MAAFLPSAGAELCLIFGCMTFRHNNNKKNGNVETFMLCEAVSPLAGCLFCSESVFISTAISANNKPLPYLHQSVAKQKASALLNALQDL